MIRANLPPFDNVDEIDFRSDTEPPHTVIEARGVSCGSTDNTNCTATDGKPHPDNGVGFIQAEDSKPIPNSITTYGSTGSDDTEPGCYSLNTQTGQIKKIHCRDCKYISTCKEKEKVKEKVNHPFHYNSGKIEVIDFIEDQKLGFHLGNAVKYICRAGKKDPSKVKEDLDKAIWYINRYKETL